MAAHTVNASSPLACAICQEGFQRVPLYVPRDWEHITDRARLRSKGHSRGPQREGETLSVRVLFCCAGLAQEDASPCHRAIAGKHFQNGSTKPLDVSFSALVGHRMLGDSVDIQLITLLGGDSSLDLEKVAFKAFGRLTSFALAGFHVHLWKCMAGIPVSRPFSDFTAERNPDRTPRSLSAGGQFRPARACARVLDTRKRFLRDRAPPLRVPERRSWQDYLQSMEPSPSTKARKEAKHKESRGGNQFPLLRNAHKRTLSPQWLVHVAASSRGSCASSSQVLEAISGIAVGRFWA